MIGNFIKIKAIILLSYILKKETNFTFVLTIQNILQEK